MPNYNEFAEAVKAKHPEYQGVDNLVLSKKMVEVYPEYKDRVSFDGAGDVLRAKAKEEYAQDVAKQESQSNPVKLAFEAFKGASSVPGTMLANAIGGPEAEQVIQENIDKGGFNALAGKTARLARNIATDPYMIPLMAVGGPAAGAIARSGMKALAKTGAILGLDVGANMGIGMAERAASENPKVSAFDPTSMGIDAAVGSIPTVGGAMFRSGRNALGKAIKEVLPSKATLSQADPGTIGEFLVGDKFKGKKAIEGDLVTRGQYADQLIKENLPEVKPYMADARQIVQGATDRIDETMFSPRTVARINKSGDKLLKEMAGTTTHTPTQLLDLRARLKSGAERANDETKMLYKEVIDGIDNTLENMESIAHYKTPGRTPVSDAVKMKTQSEELAGALRRGTPVKDEVYALSDIPLDLMTAGKYSAGKKLASGLAGALPGTKRMVASELLKTKTGKVLLPVSMNQYRNMTETEYRNVQAIEQIPENQRTPQQKQYLARYQ